MAAIESIAIFILALVGKLHSIAYLIGGLHQDRLLGVEFQDGGLGALYNSFL